MTLIQALFLTKHCYRDALSFVILLQKYGALSNFVTFCVRRKISTCSENLRFVAFEHKFW